MEEVGKAVRQWLTPDKETYHEQEEHEHTFEVDGRKMVYRKKITNQGSSSGGYKLQGRRTANNDDTDKQVMMAAFKALGPRRSDSLVPYKEN